MSDNGSSEVHKHVYWTILSGRRRRTALLVGLLVFSGFLEGIAIASVLPLLQPLTGGDSGTIRERIMSIGVSADDVVKAALVVFVLLGAISILVKYAGEALSIRLRNEIERSMRMEMSRLLLHVRWSTFLSLRLGDITQAVMLEGAHAATGINAMVHAIALSAIGVLFVILALIIAPNLTIVAAAFAILGVAGYRFAAGLAEKKTREAAAAAEVIGSHISEIFGNLKFIRSTGSVRHARALTSDAYTAYERASRLSQLYGAVLHYSFEALAFLFVGGILGYSVLRTGSLDAEALVFLAVFYRLAPRILSVQSNFHQARALRPWPAKWLNRKNQLESALEARHEGAAPSFQAEIRATNLSFSYPTSSKPVIEGADWALPKGECVAFVGGSGSGKTTMLDIVSGLLEPTAGSVLIDGRPLAEISLEGWQSKIGVVIQDSPLYHGSVLDNISFGRAADRARALRCAEMANARDFIEALPNGLDTVVGQRGGRFSGGQRQRIALARALYREPWLLILDEATSALDSAAEEIILNSLEGLKGEVSILMVAHRLRTVAIADRIFVLSEGRIAESGHIRELIAMNGTFTQMAASQGLIDSPAT